MAIADVAEAEISPGQRYMILATVSSATMLYAMTLTIANVVLPQMRGAFSASSEEIAWVVTFNLVATAVVTPISGWLANRFGRRKVMLVSALGFTIATIFCGLAESLEAIVFYRIAQGAFGAPLVPIARARNPMIRASPSSPPPMLELPGASRTTSTSTSTRGHRGA